jgi:hypothetical protein
MAITLVAFGEDIDAAGALVNLTAQADPHITTSGDTIQVPTLNNIIAVAAGVSSGGDGYGRLDSPTLERLNRLYISPTNGNADADVEPDDPPKVMDLRSHPRKLTTNESLSGLVESNTSAAAYQWILVWLSDGVVTPLPSGEIFTARATSSTTVTPRQWSNGAIVFDESLEVGRYGICGARFVSATGIAARFVLRNSGWRPGVIGADTDNSQDNSIFRFGGLGIMGEFDSVQQPSVDMLCDAGDSSADFYLDLIKLG